MIKYPRRMKDKIQKKTRKDRKKYNEDNRNFFDG